MSTMGLIIGSESNETALCAMLDGQIAHALQIGVDFERGDNQAQVGCHYLLGRQQVDGELVDFHLEFVDARFVPKDLLRGAPILLGDRGDAPLNGRFHQRAHFQQLAF